MKSHFAPFVATLILAVAPIAQALTLTDPFTDGSLTAGSDNSGIAWYDRSANSVLSIGNSPAIGSGNALIERLDNTGVASRGFVGVFNPIVLSLDNIGDTIKLTFDFALASTSATTGGPLTTTAPNNSASGFTFGLYNSNGSVVTSNDTGTSDNDFGFRADFGTGATSNIFIGKENNAGAGGLGTTTGTDTATVTLAAGSSPVQINDFLKHSASFQLTRVATGVEIVVEYDGATVATGTSTVPFTSFDEIVFSQGGGNNFHVDNVVLTNVPEPALAVSLLGGIGMLLGFRRRR